METASARNGMDEVNRGQPASDEFGQAVGVELGHQFETGEKLGEGRASVVYVAHERQTQRRVALRVISRRRLQEWGLERWMERALAASALEHPHIVPVHRFGST